MGANAQTTVPTFTASQVLTADQQNQSARTGVPVFATTTTRDAAFGGAGEKTLAEGQLCYLESTNVVQYYDGAAWATVGPTTSGLNVVQAQTSFSAAASVTADSVFTSTYETYLVRVRITTNAGNLLYRLRASGTSSSADYGHIRARNVTGTGLTATSQSAQTSGFIDGTLAGASVRAVDLILNGPQLALETPWLAHGYGVNTDDITFDAYWTGGLHNVATAYDGIELLSSSGNITGNYTIYGYAKS